MIKFQDQISGSNFRSKFLGQISGSNFRIKCQDQMSGSNFTIKFLGQIYRLNLVIYRITPGFCSVSGSVAYNTPHIIKTCPTRELVVEVSIIVITARSSGFSKWSFNRSSR